EVCSALLVNPIDSKEIADIKITKRTRDESNNNSTHKIIYKVTPQPKGKTKKMDHQQ
ncbi:10581_t:CDS:1, partial [Ambispora leptoticha]